MKKIALVLTYLLLCLLSRAAGAGDYGTIQIVIEPVFAGGEMHLGTAQYKDEHGDTLYIDLFRFYVSHISLIAGNNISVNEADSYHLADAEDAATLKITFQAPVGNYNAIHFGIGVDSLANVSGAMGGDLDPAKGMYWAWNTGYIMAKAEGRSNVCKTLHHAFEFHIGGYMPPYNALRPVTLPLKQLKVERGKTTVIKIKADMAEWFKHSRVIDLSKNNEVVMPGKEAMVIADNYAGMFSVGEIDNP